MRAARVELDETHAALDHPSRQQAAAAELLGLLVVHPVEFLRRLGFLREVHGLGRVELHLGSEFVARDARSEVRVIRAWRLVLGVVFAQRVEHAALHRRGHSVRALQIKNGIACGAQHGALIARGHVAAGPIFCAADRPADRIEHHSKAGQILACAAEAVVHPRAETRAAGKDFPRVHLQHRRTVDRRVGGHRMDEPDIVHARREVREKIAHMLAALPVLLELPLRSDHAALVPFSAAAKGLHINRLPVERVERGLVVKRVHLARPAIHEEENDALRLRREVRLLRRERIRERSGPVGSDGLAV